MFTITQNNRDEQLMRSLVNYLGFGRYVTRNGDNWEFIVTDIEAISNKVIPLFNEYPILGIKYQDYPDFEKMALLIQNKHHLTMKGLEEIRNIKAGMNKGRIN
jgi:hypothetical protein